MTPNRRPSPSQRKRMIQQIKTLRLREKHRTKLMVVIAELNEENVVLALLPTLRNRKKVLEELRVVLEHWNSCDTNNLEWDLLTDVSH